MSTPRRERPLSPFMIGPYYKAQLTSMLSITHRGTGVFLTLGSILLVWWLLALADGPESYADVEAFIGSIPGRVLLLGLGFSLLFHFLNGIRHLFWDAGLGLEIPKTYASGWTVLVLSVIGTAAMGVALFTGGAA